MWYDYTFGGRKAYLGVLGSLLIAYSYNNLPADARAGQFWSFVLGLGLCLGVIVWGNVQEHKATNGNGNNNAK